MKKCKTGCDLNSCIMCKTSLKEWLPAIEANRQNFLIGRGEEIFREGDPVKGIYFIYDGLVKIHKQWGSERELIVHFCKKGDILGHRGLGRSGTYPVSATSVEATTVCHLDFDFFRKTLKINNDFLFELMTNCVDELEESEKKMRNLVHLPVRARVAQAITCLKSIFGSDANGCINVTLSRHDLASYAGTTYETAFRTMSELIQEGLIALAGKRIQIKDEEKLRALQQTESAF